MTLLSLSLLASQLFLNQTPATLTATILELDRQFFLAFNQCDLGTMEKMYSADLEFYHDKGGLDNLAQTLSGTRKLCERELGLTRTLIPDSVRVFKIHEFGAIQHGRHRFCHLANGKQDCGEFEFMHIWKQQNTGWRLHRIISYDH